MTKMPINEAKIMPPNTGVPTSRRASCEAPTATTSGSRPRMKANDVIITGRKRSLDDQNAVLGGKPDQHDDADLRIEIERQMADDDRSERSQNANRYREQHRHRNGPAFVEPNQTEGRKQHRKTEDHPGLALGTLLLERSVGPFA